MYISIYYNAFPYVLVTWEGKSNVVCFVLLRYLTREFIYFFKKALKDGILLIANSENLEKPVFPF